MKIDRNFRIYSLVIGVCATTPLLLSTHTVQAQQAEVTSPAMQQQIMRDMTDSLQWLLSYGLEGDPDFEGQGREEAMFQTDKMATNAAMVEDHIGSSRGAAAKLSIALSEAVADMRSSIDSENIRALNFHVGNIVYQCVSCHARIPQSAESGPSVLFEIPVDLTNDVTFAPRYYAATRQFDKALDLFEERIVDHKENVTSADLDGLFDDYLWISVHASDNIDRASEFLEKVRGMIQQPNYLSRLIDIWRDDLSKHKNLASQPDTEANATAVAAQLIDESWRSIPIPFGREGLAASLVAANLLRTRLDSSQPKSDEELAEIYYQLALIEARFIGPGYGTPQMEFLMEESIRSAPGGPRAETALAILEEYGLHTAQAQSYQPEEYARSLVQMDELRKLIREQKNK